MQILSIKKTVIKCFFCYTVRLAALRRATTVINPVPAMPSSPSGLHLQVSRLGDLCLKLLVRRSRDYGLPNCAGLSSAVAESLITALADNKMLNPKTLGAFSKWLDYRQCVSLQHLSNFMFTQMCFCTSLLHKIKLDGYIYMTNELLMALRYVRMYVSHVLHFQ